MRFVNQALRTFFPAIAAALVAGIGAVVSPAVPSADVATQPPGLSAADVADRWADVRMFDDRPMTPGLSGLRVEYRLLQVFSRDAGPREARIGFNAGQGTQDLGFRSDVDILFEAAPATRLVLDVVDCDGSATTASVSAWAGCTSSSTTGRSTSNATWRASRPAAAT